MFLSFDIKFEIVFRPTTTTTPRRRPTNGHLTGYLASHYIGSILKAMWSR